MAYYELKKASSGEHFFNLKAGNHEVILTSERYTAKASAQTGIASVQINGLIREQFEARTSTADQPYFVLKAGNGEIIGRSQMYASKSAMEGGIASVMNCAATIEIREI